MDALRLVRRILADDQLGGLAPRVAVAGIVLMADGKTGLAWASYRALRRQFRLSYDSIGAGLSRALGKYVELNGVGRRRSRQYRVLLSALQQPERTGAAQRSGEAASSAPVSRIQRSGGRSNSYPTTRPSRSCPSRKVGVARARGGEEAKRLSKILPDAQRPQDQENGDHPIVAELVDMLGSSIRPTACILCGLACRKDRPLGKTPAYWFGAWRDWANEVTKDNCDNPAAAFTAKVRNVQVIFQAWPPPAGA